MLKRENSSITQKTEEFSKRTIDYLKSHFVRTDLFAQKSYLQTVQITRDGHRNKIF